MISRWKKNLLIIIMVINILPMGAVFVLYRIAMATDLPGRGNGPQDAFRHTYSSALTARYISPKAVELVSFLCERDHNSPMDLMDIHNNKIGAKIGIGEGPIYETVAKKVQEGQIDAKDADVVTWLAKSYWDGDGF
ncbi:MAG: hypothetical protein H7177_15145 [Rhizobacter sp.]|nr:hypothetical protein [Bacteriovorax sp.]